MINAAQVAAANAAADMIDPDILAIVAVSNQITAMAEEKDAFKAYWAGSASASVCHHYAVGAVKTVRAR